MPDLSKLYLKPASTIREALKNATSARYPDLRAAHPLFSPSA